MRTFSGQERKEFSKQPREEIIILRILLCSLPLAEQQPNLTSSTRANSTLPHHFIELVFLYFKENYVVLVFESIKCVNYDDTDIRQDSFHGRASVSKLSLSYRPWIWHWEILMLLKIFNFILWNENNTFLMNDTNCYH